MTKKNFENNPAMAFLKTTQPAEVKKVEEVKPARKTAKDKIAKTPVQKTAEKENRTQRLQVVLPPSLYEELKETAWKNRVKSVNEAVNIAIAEYIKKYSK